MARLSDELIQQLKNDISILRLAESYGIELKKHGKDYLGRCPFHDDKTPSFVISPQNNLWHCLGACNEGGSTIDFVMKIETLSFRHAVEKLKQDFLSLAADTQKIETPTQPSSLAADPDDQVLLKRVIEFYHATLKQSPEALAYLDSRGLNDPALIDHFKLGYANRSLGYRLPPKNRKAGEEIRSQLQRIGLYRDSGHEHFNGSLVIPICVSPMMDGGNESYQITEVYGRKLLNNLRKGTPKHLYLPGPHEGIFNAACFQSEEVILCESLIDALTFWRWDFKHVTCSYGIAGFTDALLDAFKQHQTQRVLIAYDRDDAGNQAAEKVAQTLMPLGIDCYRVLFPKGMDANEYACKMTPSRKSLELVIRKAEFMGKGQKDRPENEADLPSLAANLAVKNEMDIPLPATPEPAMPTSDIEAQVSDNEVILPLGSRRYRVRGLGKAMSYEQLKINLAASNDQGMHIDHLDVYHAKQRLSFIKQSAIELGVTEDLIKADMAKILLTLERLQDERIQAKLSQDAPKNEVEISQEAQQSAMDLLRDPNLLDRILEDFNRAGVVGEESNKLVGYLAAVSRKLDNPLAVMIQSTSAAGKSSLMNAVLAMMPEEQRIQYSAMTGQSLFYMGETNLKHKILAIAEEEGADQASYALKLLQSESELTIASTGKDADGNLTTQEYRVEGPVMLFSTTTAIDIDEELMNRCLVLTVNESRAQTQRIHQMQRRKRTLAGLADKVEKKRIVQVHQNAQRLLKPIHIVNPYADQLTFLDDKTRLRRDHDKYLSLIDTVTLLHQYQRPKKQITVNDTEVEYIEVSLSDIETANRLAHEVLGRTLDELPPQTRQLLRHIHAWVSEQCERESMAQGDFRFSRRLLREHSGWGDTQLKVHLVRLVEMEYLIAHRQGQAYAYELLYQGEGEAGNRFIMSLIDVEKLGAAPEHPCSRGTSASCTSYDANRSGSTQSQSVPGRPMVGDESGGGQSASKRETPDSTSDPKAGSKVNGKTHSSVEKHPASYRTIMPASLAASSSVEVS